MSDRRRDGLATVGLQGAVIAAGLAIWEGAVRAGRLSEEFTSRPSAVATEIWRWVATGELWPHLGATVGAALAGLVVGLALGAAVGLLLALAPPLASLCEPALATLNATPRIVFYPLLALWLGLGVASKVALVVTIVLFVGLFNTLGAVREIDRTLVAQVRLLGASPAAMLRHVYLPAALVWIAAGLRTSLGFAFVGTILGEYMASMRGLGHLIIGAQHLFQTSRVMAGLVVAMVLVWLLDAAVARLDARWSVWRQEPRYEG
ncbi:MAG: ABC transporter permease [Armatimonadota bacterium]|nr:ABC transporter permease [Armatimonadota bacterium]MDR7486032.1 ABC transporter permease [Armatimonadota bacterium]MDR7532603.1 ABC transporter permease [Armatimonadota bacterium]MDR7536188.1 ABC transporter permease [Armatimonadota bacterium]